MTPTFECASPCLPEGIFTSTTISIWSLNRDWNDHSAVWISINTIYCELYKKNIYLFNIPSIPVGLGRKVISTKLVVSEQLCNLCMSAGAAGWESDSCHQLLSSRWRERLVDEYCHWIANLCGPGKLHTNSAGVFLGFFCTLLLYWICIDGSSLCVFVTFGIKAPAGFYTSVCKAHVKAKCCHCHCEINIVFPFI